MPDLPRFRHMAYEQYVRFLPGMVIRATPYENASLGSAGGLYQNAITMVDTAGTVVDGSLNEFKSHRSPRPGLGSNRDVRLTSATFSGTGWDFTFEIKAPRSLQASFNRGQGMAAWLTCLIDKPDAGSQSWYALFDQQIATCFIREVGTKQGPRQENIIVITASTPDRFLSEPQVDKLPYLLKAVVDKERIAVSALSRTNLSLGFPDGYTLQGTGPITADPFAEFANVIDTYTAPPEALLSVRPANENHFLVALSVQKALFGEYLPNHVLCDRGSGYTSLLNQFDTEIDLTGDLEDNVVDHEIGAGSPQDAILESLRHGVFRYWWTARSKLVYKSDYCCSSYGSLIPQLVILNGKSALGELEVQLGPSNRRINRVACRGEMLTGILDGADPMQNYAMSGLMGAVYPPGTGIGNVGSDVQFENYVGQRASTVAKRLWSKSNQMTTAQLSGFPFAPLAVALAGRIVGIATKHQLEGYDWTDGATSRVGIDVGGTGAYSSNGKLFSVDSVTIENTDPEAPGGGFFTSTLGMTEIIPLQAA
jgi:hypothetical protein